MTIKIDTTPFKTQSEGINTLTSSELFQGERLVIIKHAGEEYRLSITSKDRLILTK